MNLVSAEIENYCKSASTSPSKAAHELFEYTKKNVADSEMLIGTLEASFLAFIIKLRRIKNILEIGTYTGYSALVMAEALEDEGRITTLDIDQNTMEIAKQFWQKSSSYNKINPVLGDANNSLAKLDTKFDMVFIDADKSNYVNYLKKSLKLIEKNGVIFIDNCLWSGKVVEANPDESTQAIIDVSNYVKNSKELISTLIPIRDGILCIQFK